MTSATTTVAESAPGQYSQYNKGELAAQETISTGASSHLRQTLTIALDNESHVQKELEALQDIDTNASRVAVNAEGQVAIVAQRVASGVEAHKLLPQLQAGVAS